MSQFGIEDDSWRPGPGFLKATFDAIQGLVSPSANRRRLRAKARAAVKYQERYDAAVQKIAAHRKKVCDDPRLSVEADERRQRSKRWTWKPEFMPDPADMAATPKAYRAPEYRDAEAPPGRGAWVPTSLPDESKLPPEPIPHSAPSYDPSTVQPSGPRRSREQPPPLPAVEPDEVPAEVILAGKYLILAIIHDDMTRAAQRNCPMLLAGISLPPSLSVFSHYGPGRHLGMSGFDRETIKRALQDVKADLALVESQTTTGARTDVQEAADIRQAAVASMSKNDSPTERTVKLRQVAAAFREFQRRGEEINDTSKSKPGTPERGELCRDMDAALANAFDEAFKYLPLLYRCGELYGCSAQTEKNLALIKEYASLPTAKRMPFIAQWYIEFVLKHPTTGEINSPVDDLERWASELERVPHAASDTGQAVELTGDRDRPSEDRHAEYVTTKEAIRVWDVSRATLNRYREEGKLTGHRPPKAPLNASYRYDPADLDSHFSRRKRPRETPRA